MPEQDKSRMESQTIGAEELIADGFVGRILEEKIELQCLLGKGASGNVYKGFHRHLDKTVAVKILNGSLLDSETSLQRFRNEAQLLSAFDNEHIVKILSFASTPDGYHYMVLEYVEGKTLEQILAEGTALPFQSAVNIFTQICSGLAYAHSRNVIHRDIKPGNIMVADKDGCEFVKILDFGIFKSINNGNQRLTQTGLLLGSAKYMSPEQCRNDFVDERSDIYSLACLMYETLTGQAPMQGSTDLLVMSNHLNKKIDAVPARYPIPKNLEDLILRCLAKNPADRCANASDLLLELSTASSSDFQKASKKLPLEAILLALALTAVACLAVYHFQSKKGHSEIPIPTSVNNRREENEPKLPITTQEEFIAARDWLMKHPLPKILGRELDTVALVYAGCLSWKNSHKSTEAIPREKQIMDLLESNIGEGGTDWKMRQMRLAHIRLINEDYESVSSILSWFERENPAGCSSLYRSLLVSYGNQKKKLELIKRIQNFANKNKYHTLLSEAYVDEAEYLLNTNDLSHGKELVNLAYQELLRGFEAQEDAADICLSKLASLLNKFGQHDKVLSMISTVRPDILEDKSNEQKDPLNDYSKRVIYEVAAAHKAKREFPKAQYVARNLLKRLKEKKPNESYSDEVELFLLGVACAKNDNAEAIRQDAESYLKWVEENSPNRFESSFMAVSTKLNEMNKYTSRIYDLLKRHMDKIPASQPDLRRLNQRLYLVFLDQEKSTYRDAFALTKEMYDSLGKGKPTADEALSICLRLAIYNIQDNNHAKAKKYLDAAKKYLAGASDSERFTYEYYRGLYLDLIGNRQDAIDCLTSLVKSWDGKDVAGIRSYASSVCSLAGLLVEEGNAKLAAQCLYSSEINLGKSANSTFAERKLILAELVKTYQTLKDTDKALQCQKKIAKINDMEQRQKRAIRFCQ